jgi:4-hydroxy-2-oxoheptanedioate aldolase
MTGNRLRRVWDTRAVLGAWCWIPAPAVVEQLVWCGFDFILFDCQHGEYGISDLEPLLRVTTNTEVTPVVRVPTNDYYAIGHALDAGAEVIVVPMVETREDAERAAAASRFFPAGTRSYAGTRSTQVLGADPEQVNREVACLAMVETATGLANVAEIAATPHRRDLRRAGGPGHHARSAARSAAVRPRGGEGHRPGGRGLRFRRRGSRAGCRQ